MNFSNCSSVQIDFHVRTNRIATNPILGEGHNCLGWCCVEGQDFLTLIWGTVNIFGPSFVKFSGPPPQVINDRSLRYEKRKLWDGNLLDIETTFSDFNIPEALCNQGHPTRIFSKLTWNILSCFLRMFQSCLKAYLCKLLQIDLFGVFSWKFRPQKILTKKILSAEFPSCWWFSEIAS